MSAGRLAFVGSRTTARRGHGRGIYSYRVDGANDWQLLNTTEAVNPGFLAVHERHQRLYAASGDHDYITAYRYDANGMLSNLGRVPSGGTNPAHLVLDPTGSWLLVANHSSGSVTCLPVLADGRLGEEVSRIDFAGEPGPHRTDQTGPKPHQVIFSPDGSWIAVPDKGLDVVHRCTLDPASGELTLEGHLAVREMSGPRHAVFAPRTGALYVINELSNTLTVFTLDPAGRTLGPVQVLPTQDELDVRDSRAAEILISPDGRFVYATNRSGAGDHTPGGPGEDTIASYSVSPAGTLRLLGHQRAGGVRPRFATFTADGKALLVANEKSDSLTLLPLGPDGTLTTPRELAAPASPVCVVFVPVPGP